MTDLESLRHKIGDRLIVPLFLNNEPTGNYYIIQIIDVHNSSVFYEVVHLDRSQSGFYESEPEHEVGYKAKSSIKDINDCFKYEKPIIEIKTVEKVVIEEKEIEKVVTKEVEVIKEKLIYRVAQRWFVYYGKFSETYIDKLYNRYCEYKGRERIQNDGELEVEENQGLICKVNK